MYEDITPESIKEEILKSITKVDTREGSYTNDLVSPAALQIWKAYQGLSAVFPIAYIDETSGPYIDKRCSEIGLARKAGTKATATLTLTGMDGTLVPAGTAFLTPDNLEFTTDADATISEGQATVGATAAEVGENYNAAAGTITGQYNSIAGLSAVTNGTAAQGGTDPETDASLVARYYAARRNPSTGGNVYDYKNWALEVDGVGGVKVIPLKNGAGTVGVMIASAAVQPVDAAVVAACAAHIEGKRPIGPSVEVLSMQALTIGITAAVTHGTTVTAAGIRDELTKKANEYLKSAAEAYMGTKEYQAYTLLYNRIAYQLLGIAGVEDYSDLKINGGTGNITIAADQVPVLGSVVISDDAD